MGTTLRVFTSSTYRDLLAERSTIRHVIDELAADGRPVEWVGMEAFGALSTSPLLASEEFAERADIVVLLVGERVGSYAPEQPFSFTAAEWNVVRRDRIPCLAYLKNVSEEGLEPDVALLRKQLREELVCQSFRDADDLASKVRSDLERELRGMPSDRSILGLTVEPPPSTAASFVGRDEELAALGAALRKPDARVGICGPPGIGKTTFVRQFFSKTQEELLEPLWLRTDDLFGTDAGGQRRLDVVRWDRQSLLDRLTDVRDAHPRGVFVFDNVQAAPLMVRWVASRLSSSSCLFLTWDADSLPGTSAVIRLGPLARDASRAIFRQYVPVRGHEESADRLCGALGDYPLLMDLASRRLALDLPLTLDELHAELATIDDRLALRGPTIDRPEVIARRVFVSSYLRLRSSEREALTALAAVPPDGISARTMSWAVETFSRGEFKRVDRAIALGFVDGRPFADWRGHRYYLRGVIADFLRTTASYPTAAEEFSRYLDSRSSLDDESSDIVAHALTNQLDRDCPDLPWDGDWLETLVLEARPQLRARVGQVLREISETKQIAAIVERLAFLLTAPRSEASTLEALRLLGGWKEASIEEPLRRLWRRPLVRDEDGERSLLPDVQVEAGRLLAARRGIRFDEFLLDELRSPRRSDRIAAIDAAGRVQEPALRDELLRAFNDPALVIRQEAVRAVGSYEPTSELADAIWRAYEDGASDDPSSIHQELGWVLGLWKDERILPELLASLDDEDADVRAESISVLWRYPRPEVADRLASLAVVDPALHVRQNATFILADFLDPRAADAIAVQLRSHDPETQRIGLFAAGRLSSSTLSDATIDELATEISTFLKDDLTETRLVARGALISFRDPRGCDGLLADLALPAAQRHPTFRWYPLLHLAEWRPAEFEPQHLRPLLHDSDAQMRGYACVVAGQARAPTLVPDLHSLLGDDSPFEFEGATVANAASHALDRIAGKRPPWEPHPKSHRPSHS